MEWRGLRKGVRRRWFRFPNLICLKQVCMMIFEVEMLFIC